MGTPVSHQEDERKEAEDEKEEEDQEAQVVPEVAPEVAPEANLDLTPEGIVEEVVDTDDCKSVEILSSDSGIGVTPPEGPDAGYRVATALLDTTRSLIKEGLDEMDKS